MPPKTKDLIKSYISDLEVGDLFSIDDVIAWFKATWPRYTPNGNGIGCYMRSYENVQILGNGIYKVIS